MNENLDKLVANFESMDQMIWHLKECVRWETDLENKEEVLNLLESALFCLSDGIKNENFCIRSRDIIDHMDALALTMEAIYLIKED